jgi:2-aminoethylphosphonate-pyruvate transaminase
MQSDQSHLPPRAADKPLFTPGPLTTSLSVKQAMLRDLGSRDEAFIRIVREVRDGLLAVAGVRKGDYEAVPMQGSGTFAIESVFSTCVPQGGKVLIAINGAYGKRMQQICGVLGIETAAITEPEHAQLDPGAIKVAMENDPSIAMVAVVHCETTTGIFNPIEAIGEAVHAAGRHYFVDAMSSFGAVPIDFAAAHIDYLVSSANKCIEGVPGFAFAIARTDALTACEGNARSLSLDLLAQWRGLEQNGQFRFTPPTHALLAFHQALQELESEGGVDGRAARYRRNYETTLQGMRALGFEEYLAPDDQGYIITSFRYPDHPNFAFETFYNRLSDAGYVIYPGKVSDADCFRIGHIGRLFEADVQALVRAVAEVLQSMNVNLSKDS